MPRSVATRSRRRVRRREAAVGYGLLAPSLVGILAFLVIPIIVAFWLSFQRWNLISPPKSVGWANWSAVLSDPGVRKSALVTIEYVILVIPAQTVLGVLLAVLIHRGLRGSGFARAVLVVPWVCAPLALGVVWQWIFALTDGALNRILGTSIAWLSSPHLALICVAVVAIWSQTGYVMLFFLAGLATLPPELYEAAELDGASAWRSFWYLTLPMLRPTTFFVLVTTTIGAFQTFDTIYALTKGGPGGATDVIAMHIYTAAFQTFDMGRAATIAILLFVVLVLVSLAQQAWFRKRITYDLG